MPITFNHSNIGVQYSTGSNYIIETVKSDLYRRNELIDTITRDNLQTAPVTPSMYIENGTNNVYAVESYTYSGTANTADFTRVFTKSTTCDILIVGGGGAGGTYIGGGGGGGGVLHIENATISAGTYNIQVGKGGTGVTGGASGTTAQNGSSSKAFGIEVFGGGYGGVGQWGTSAVQQAGANGGSGGGGGSCYTGTAVLGGTVIQPSFTSSVITANNYTYYGGNGASGILFNNNSYGAIGANGGGGAGGNAPANTDQLNAGAGADGIAINITGTSYFWGGGGGGGLYGGTYNGKAGNGGKGGGGGGSGSQVADQVGIGGIGGITFGQDGDLEGDGTPTAGNGGDGTGGGGGGCGRTTASPNAVSGKGGSGIVIIRYLLGTIPANNLLTSEPVVIAPTFTESIRTFTHSGGTEAQTTHTITVGRDTICDILVVGGGGAGGKDIGAGGGGGAVLYGANISIAAGTYIIKVGRGGTPGEVRGQSSEAFGATLLGGGCAGNVAWGINTTANSGGSGSGGKAYWGVGSSASTLVAGGVGISTNGIILTTATLYNGNVGGTAIQQVGGNPIQSAGGGGAGAVGGNGNGSGTKTGNGGAGVLVNITGVNYYWGGGGGGGGYQSTPTDGGRGGGGAGERNDGQGSLGFGTGGADAYNAPVNMNGGAGSGGGGGGSGHATTTAGNGGSGIVIIKLKSFTGPILEGITHKRLNFAFDSLGFSFDATKYIEYQTQLKTGVGGWRIVRFLPPNLGRWYSGNNFTSTSVNSTNIGTAYNYTNEWGVPFGTFDEMFFGTYDMTYWLRCLKTSVLGTYDNALRPIISSSSSSTPYSARWYQRDSAIHEPWVSITDHNSVPQLIVYGENGNLGGTGLINAYGGMCVLVRDSATATTISIPNTYTINFPVPTIADINNNSNIVLRGAYDIALSTSNALIIPKEGQHIHNPSVLIRDSSERIYPPVRNFTSDTTIISGQLYGNGTYIVSASTFFIGEETFRVFNGTNSGWTQSTAKYDGSPAGTYTGLLSLGGFTGEWIKVQFPVSIKLTRYIIEASSIGGVNRAPSVYKIFGSNNNIDWEQVVYKSVPLVSSNYISNKYEEKVSSNNYYRFFALVIGKNMGLDSWLSIGEWYIYGKEFSNNSLSIRYNILNPILDPIGAQWTYSSSNTNVYHMGSVGIGTTRPEYQLDVRGAIYSYVGGYTQTGLTTWTVTSDKRIKDNIVRASYDKCLENVKNIELYNFNFKNNCINTNDKHQLGFIAQEVQQVYPKAVEVGKIILNTNEAIDDILTLNTTQIDYTLYGAVKNLIEKIEYIDNDLENIEKAVGMGEPLGETAPNAVIKEKHFSPRRNK